MIESCAVKQLDDNSVCSFMLHSLTHTLMLFCSEHKEKLSRGERRHDSKLQEDAVKERKKIYRQGFTR